MSVPRLIEYIESIKAPLIRGTHIGAHGGGQIIVPIFPPGLTVNQVITPPVGVYTIIIYRVDFGNSMVPNAFLASVQHRGYSRYSGVLSATLLDNGMEGFLVVTNESPLHVTVTNNSGLNQYLEEIYQYAAIYTESDFNFVYDLLNDLANRGQSEVQTEALQLLRQIAGVAPVTPHPPIGEV